MAKKKNEYYAVASGRIPGIYSTWDECKKQVSGFPNASYHGFPTKEEAVAFMNQVASTDILKKTTAVNIFVDGSYFNSRYSWAFAVYEDNALIHSANGVGEDNEAAKMNNVAGELAGAVHAIRWAEDNNKQPITIHHDYSGLANWATGAWKANNTFTAKYAEFAKSRLDWVQFNKVEGHSGVAGNELVDKLAKAALGITG